jgi:predicted metal-dependent peptidase
LSSFPIESQIHLDLVELEHRNCAASVNDLEGLVQSLKFENILQYVQIPRNLFSSTTKVASSIEDTEHQDGIGRTDFKLIFELLKKKGVSKIIKLIVDDDEDTPHSDDVIETLRCFNI